MVAGLVRPEPPVEALISTLGGCLRAVLRDVLCGHLEPELRRVADELLADSHTRAGGVSAPSGRVDARRRPAFNRDHGR